MERVKPAARLIDAFGNEVGRIRPVEDFFVLERIMPLRKRHGAGIEPHIDQFRRTFHGAATIIARKRDFVHVRLVEIERIGNVLALLQFLNTSNALLFAALLTNPDWERRAPKTVP